MDENTILQELNESQREAVLFCDGPSLVIAGAGSGKTRVLTYKIAYLLEQGLKPWQILALTFTNKAAREMKERIGRLVGEERARYLQMGTFHSVFSRILRAEADKLGFSNSFTIYDQTDARSLVKAIIKEMGLDDKVYKPASVADRISMAKNHLILASQYGQTAWAQDDAQGKRPQIANIYIRYAERCRQSNAMACRRVSRQAQTGIYRRTSSGTRMSARSTSINSSLCLSTSIRTPTSPSRPSCCS